LQSLLIVIADDKDRNLRRTGPTLAETMLNARGQALSQ